MDDNVDADGSGCPVMHKKAGGGCPMEHGSGGGTDGKEGELNPANNMPFAELLQGAAEGQSRPLSKFRMASSIPNASAGNSDALGGDAAAAEGTTMLPAHQPGDGERTWMYPSEQQYFNAMRRKGWAPREADVRM